MTKLPILLGAAVALAGASAAGAAAAHCYPRHVAYVTRYHPHTRYVRRTVVVRERVWRPVRERVIYAPPVRRAYAYDRYPVTYARTVVAYEPGYVDEGPDYGWDRGYLRVHDHGWHRGWRHCRPHGWD
jgi:hypothetical protein